MKWMTGKIQSIKKEKSGFTLVELIVVLVILGILAAITVPALTGWIDKAKEKQDVLVMNDVVKAAKSAYAEMYAETGGTEFSTYRDSEDDPIFREHLLSYLSEEDFDVAVPKSQKKYILTYGYRDGAWAIVLYVSKTKSYVYYWESEGTATIVDDLGELPDETAFSAVLMGHETP